MLYEFDGKQPEVGKDTYVSKHALVIGDVSIEDNCYIGHGAILRGDYGRIVIGSGTAIEEGVIVHAPPDRTCVIGKKVTVGHGAIIHASRIGNFAVIGMGAVLSLGSKVGMDAIIAEGCIVKMKQSIPDGVVAAGNPAKVIREVTKEDKQYWALGKQIYIDLSKKYINVGIIRYDNSSHHS